MKSGSWIFGTIIVALAAWSSLGCLTKSDSKLSGTVKVDGSSTVYPISEAMAEEFQKKYPTVRVTVGISGTGGGFKKFTTGETDISNASRPITDRERETARRNNVEFIELPIAYDGIAVVVNLKSTFVDYLSVDELKRIWQPGSTVTTWADVRAPWPKETIRLYGPGTDSGTFDYFTEEIVGKARASRSDFSPSEDDNVLVQGVVGDPFSLGYFGFSYYEENRDRLRVVPVLTPGGKPVTPSAANIENGTYRPLSRPVFIYVNRVAADTRPEVGQFVTYYLEQATTLVPQVGDVPLSKELYTLAKLRFDNRLTGTVFGSVAPELQSNIAELLTMKGQ